MSKVRAKNTAPEMRVRRLLFAAGFRYRLHVKALPGKPDLVFHGRKKVIFVHGCFWHRHACEHGRLPKSRVEFWTAKLEGNRDRDAVKQLALLAEGWSVMVVWECELGDAERLLDRLTAFLRDESVK